MDWIHPILEKIHAAGIETSVSHTVYSTGEVIAIHLIKHDNHTYATAYARHETIADLGQQNAFYLPLVDRARSGIHFLTCLTIALDMPMSVATACLNSSVLRDVQIHQEYTEMALPPCYKHLDTLRVIELWRVEPDNGVYLVLPTEYTSSVIHHLEELVLG